MREEKKAVTETSGPVIDQQIIRRNRPKWLLWLLPLLLLLLLIIWFARSMMAESAADAQAGINSTPQSIDGNALDEMTVWLNGDKKSDSGWIALDGISFRSGSADPVINDAAKLEKTADALNTHPDIRVVIRGFADASGPQALNDRLSSERADAVQTWFTQHNVSAERISIDGRGASAPVADNATAEGREMNRRVALKMIPGSD